MTREPESPPTPRSKSTRAARSEVPSPREPALRRLLLPVGAAAAVPLLLLTGFLLGRPTPETAPTDTVSSAALTGLRQELQELRKAAPVTRSDPGLQELRRELEVLREDASELKRGMLALAKRPVPVTPGPPEKVGPELKQLQESLARLDKTTEGLRREVERLKPATTAAVPKLQPEPFDVLVLAFHSENLGLNHYLTPFRELCTDPARLALQPSYRLALALVDGNKGPELIYPFADRERKQIFRLYPAATGTTDRVDALGLRVRELFKDAERVRRQCLIVASARCVPVPPARFKEWDGLHTSVLLIGPEKYVNDLSSEQWKCWLDFCSHTGGRFAVLVERGPAPDEQVQQRLREYLRDWTQPIYPLGRK